MNTNPPITPNRGRVLAVLVAALLVAGLATEFLLSTDHGSWQPASQLVYCGVIALFPFLLARLAPTAAAFDTQWLPSSRRHWAWFLGMLVVSFLSKALVVALAAVVIGFSPPEPPRALSAPIGIIFEAIAALLVGPLAEEILFRGFLLEQFSKLVRSSIALLAQSFLFGLAHLYTWGFYPLSFFNSLDVLLFALIVGLWRIKFRSLLPIVLVHILGNAPGISLFVDQYNYAVSITATDAGAAQSDENGVTATQELADRAEALFNEGEYPLALREIEKLIELQPRNFAAHYLRGWIYATSPDQGCRDKEKAMLHATKAVTLWLQDVPGTERTYWMAWACLAAAYAERGDFDKAIENQKKAIEYLRFVAEEWRPSVEPRVKACLLLYTARKPLRSKRVSLGKLSDAWFNSMLHPGPKGFPEIAE
jgi:membrane protease YdiL (CAAX protease family)